VYNTLNKFLIIHSSLAKNYSTTRWRMCCFHCKFSWCYWCCLIFKLG